MMGKPTGFMEYERVTSRSASPKERIKDFDEFHEHLSMEDQQKQGARCMDCGVPFCQYGKDICGMTSGCPLHNLVPEWNDLVYHGNWEQAYNRLHKTNNFPEFTSRVCPALCEKACTCGLDSEPVAVQENEYAIIENAYAKGYAAPKPPKVRKIRSRSLRVVLRKRTTTTMLSIISKNSRISGIYITAGVSKIITSKSFFTVSINVINLVSL